MVLAQRLTPSLDLLKAQGVDYTSASPLVRMTMTWVSVACNLNRDVETHDVVTLVESDDLTFFPKF